jgi:hypothetical protein
MKKNQKGLKPQYRNGTRKQDEMEEKEEERRGKSRQIPDGRQANDAKQVSVSQSFLRTDCL